MRKEDKVRLPPKLKVKLPRGFYLERKPGKYLLYVTYHYRQVTMHDLVGIFTSDTSAEEIEQYAAEKRIERVEKGDGD
jgi:hypothetical protein